MNIRWHLTTSVTSKMSPNVYKSRKMKYFSTFTKIAQHVRDLGKIIVVKGFKKLPKVQHIAQSGHTADYLPKYTKQQLCTYLFVIFLLVSNRSWNKWMIRQKLEKGKMEKNETSLSDNAEKTISMNSFALDTYYYYYLPSFLPTSPHDRVSLTTRTPF